MQLVWGRVSGALAGLQFERVTDIAGLGIVTNRSDHWLKSRDLTA